MMNDLDERFLYSNGTLRNKLNIRNQKLLSSIEYKMTAKISKMLLRQSIHITNLTQLKDIHYAMFSTLYTWAGKFRDYQLQKDTYQGSSLIKNWFLPSDKIPYGCQNINNLLHEADERHTLSSKYYATLLDRMNYLHPFREGNGRATKVFIQLLAKEHHQFIDYPRTQVNIIKGLNESNVDLIASCLKIQPYVRYDQLLKSIISNYEDKNRKP